MSTNRRQPVAPTVEVDPYRLQPLRALDWLTEVAIPVCIFGMLGCLLYYLIDLRAAAGGGFNSILRWVCFWFLLAVIAITRIRTKYGDSVMAAPYSVGLGVAVGFFIFHYTVGGDTLFGELSSATGALVSLLFNYAVIVLIWWAASRITRECTAEEHVEEQIEHGLFSDLSDEFERPADRSQRPAHPGRSILWVCLIAAIIFGFGSRLVAPGTTVARHSTWCVAGFGFFALALLALTNLSALRMDVRVRKIWMSSRLAPNWIVTSLVLTILLVLLAAAMPAVHHKLTRQTFGQSHREQQIAQGGRGPAVGMRQAQRPGRGGEQWEYGGRGQQPGGEESQARQGQREGVLPGGDQPGQGSGQTGTQQGEGSGQGSGRGSPTLPSGSAIPEGIARLLLWILVLLMLAAIVWAVASYWRRLGALLGAVVAGLGALWRRLAGLFGRRPAAEEALPHDPFADIFTNTSLLERLSPEQVVRHIYRAFVTYATVAGHPRGEGQTEMEFARGLPYGLGLERGDTRRLTYAYIQVAYSDQPAREDAVEMSREVWDKLLPCIERLRDNTR